MPVKVTKDNFDKVMRSIANLTKTQALVGVPAEKAARKGEEGEKGPLNNAEIGYLMETGMPEKNVPARSFLVPGIEVVKDRIAAELRTGATKALGGDTGAAETVLGRVGMIAQAAVRQKITDGPFVPLSPKTVEARARRRGTKRRKSEKKYLEMVASGSTPAEAQAATGIKPLIDTSQLRNAIGYVVRRKGG